MRVDCYQCGAAYQIPDAAVTEAGVRTECPKCGHQETIRPDRSGVGPAPQKKVAPAAAAASQSTDRDDLFDYSRSPTSPGAAAPSQGGGGGGLADDPFADIDTGSGPAPGPFGTGAGAAAPAAGEASPPAEPKTSGPTYRIKKPDGMTWGPMPLPELERMCREGEVAPGDQVAKNEDEFRLMSQYPECAPLLKIAAANYTLSGAAIPYRDGGGGGGRTVAIVAGGLIGSVLIVVLALARFSPETLPDGLRGALSFITPDEKKGPSNPVLAHLGKFQLEVVETSGTAGANLKKARALMLEDTRDAYIEADEYLKRALIQDPNNTDALSRLIVNTAYVHRWNPEPKLLQEMLAFANYLKVVAPNDPQAQLGRAASMLMLGAGQAPEARYLAEEALKTNPNDIEAKVIAARATNFIDHQKAQKMLEALRVNATDFPRVHTELGLVCREAGDFACAEKAYRARLKMTPGHDEASAALANLYVQLGEHESARGVYRITLMSDPDRVDAELAIIVLNYQVKGDLRVSLWQLKKLIKNRLDLAEDETAHRAKVHAAAIYRLMNKDKDAQRLVDEVLEADGLHGPASYQAALLALRSGDAGAANGHLATVAGAADSDEMIAMLRVMIESARENHDVAAQEADRLAKRTPNDLYAVLLAVASDGARGRDRAAFARMREVVKIDPIEARRASEITDYYDGGVIHVTLRRGLEALVDKAPEQGLSHAALGVGWYLAGNSIRAKREFDKAVDLDEQNLPAHMYLGLIAWDKRDLGGAERAFRVAIESNRLAPLPQYLLGRTMEAREKDRSAMRAYDKALQLDPSFHPAQIRKALLRAASGNRSEARETLRRVLIAHPSSVDARVALYQLE